ncbi:MAG: uncharacterized protein QOD77_1748 [Thermoplasmata archaeon]|nr:uncharacterized protein [Thermoplasmata archaeon]
MYNCYDPKQWHEIMRITLARAAPVAMAFDCRLATFGFPFEQARARGAKRTEALRSPADVAGFVAEGTSIGEGGRYLAALVEEGRVTLADFPKDGVFPAKLGQPFATTPHPGPGKATTPRAAAEELAAGRDVLLVFGLGPRGLPDAVLEAAPRHLELTGKGIEMETATALAALPAMVRTHLGYLEAAP